MRLRLFLILFLGLVSLLPHAEQTYSGYVLSWPRGGEGLIMGWSTTFASRSACQEWVHATSSQALRVRTVTHNVAGGCQP